MKLQTIGSGMLSPLEDGVSLTVLLERIFRDGRGVLGQGKAISTELHN
jgi:hypothetical protein